MAINNNITELIGATPLVGLARVGDGLEQAPDLVFDVGGVVDGQGDVLEEDLAEAEAEALGGLLDGRLGRAQVVRDLGVGRNPRAADQRRVDAGDDEGG